MTTKAATNADGQHPFGELLAQYRQRRLAILREQGNRAKAVEMCADDLDFSLLHLGAVWLRGISDHCLALCHLRRWGHNEWECAPYMAKARAALGDEAFDMAYAEGYAMPLDQAVAYALGEDHRPDAR